MYRIIIYIYRERDRERERDIDRLMYTYRQPILIAMHTNIKFLNANSGRI